MVIGCRHSDKSQQTSVDVSETVSVDAVDDIGNMSVESDVETDVDVSGVIMKDLIDDSVNVEQSSDESEADEIDVEDAVVSDDKSETDVVEDAESTDVEVVDSGVAIDSSVVESVADGLSESSDDVVVSDEISDESRIEAGSNSKNKTWSTKFVAIAAVATLVIGGVCGYAICSASSSGMKPIGKSVVSDADLDKPIAYYVLDGVSHPVSAREVINIDSSLDTVEVEKGSYSVPTADAVISYVRNRIIAKAAEDKGITISDDDLVAYAKSMLGSDDFSAIADSYGMTEDNVKSVLRESAQVQKLRESVVSGDDTGSAPALPEEPVVDGIDKMSEKEAKAAREAANAKIDKKYADYVIKLVGNEWNADAGKWASDDSAYAKALASFEFSDKGTSYDAALAAYYVAYQAWSSQKTGQESTWNDYVNDLFDDVSVTVLSVAM